MALIGMAISVAFAASWASEFGLLDLEFWWELAGLIVIMLLGHWQEMKAIGQAQSALESLAELLPDEAELVEDDDTRTVPSTSCSPVTWCWSAPARRCPPTARSHPDRPSSTSRC